MADPSQQALITNDAIILGLLMAMIYMVYNIDERNIVLQTEFLRLIPVDAPRSNCEECDDCIDDIERVLEKDRTRIERQ